jgi:GT2 family glycosyltransferase
LIVSIETPVFKSGRLQRCIDSVLYQSSPDWEYSLLWDGGDAESRRILEDLQRRKLPNVTVHFGENRGIARARRFLSEHSRGDFILPLDDDDALPFHAVERFLHAAAQKPWAAVIRAQRTMIDEEGRAMDAPAWFPFEPRHYQRGMVTDLSNHSQPNLISRWAYERTSGWEGFEDFGFAGEDCDLYLKLEEVGTIELLDETLYYYRVHPNRQSLVLTNEAAYEMWRRLADKTIERIGLPLRRASEMPPYAYEPLLRPAPALSRTDFVIVAPAGRPERAIEALRRARVDDGAVQVADGAGAADLNRACRRGTRPFLCVVDAGVDLDQPGALETLVRLMHESDADLAAPKLLAPDGSILWGGPGAGDTGRGRGEPDDGRYDATTSAAWLSEWLMLTRREVVKALGGFDEGFGDRHTAMADFCLRARRRDFACRYLGGVGFTYSGPRLEPDDPAAAERMRRKWSASPQLRV